MSRRKKALKLPNGFGSIDYLGEGRRKPWRARKTEGWELVHIETGKALKHGTKLAPEQLHEYKEKQKRINVGTFETYEEALIALSRYNENPHEVEAEKITFENVVDMWMESSLKKFSERTQSLYISSLNRLPDALCKMKISEIKTTDIERAIKSLNTTLRGARLLKNVVRHIFIFAIKHEYCSKNYADYLEPEILTSRKTTHLERMPLTPEEISAIHANDSPDAKMILVALYTGMRPEEIITLETKHLFLEDGYIMHGCKTKAGRNRTIPIHKMIHPILTDLKNNSSTGYIFETQGHGVRPYSYRAYYNRVKKLLPGHRPHDTRHTFITQWRSVLKLNEKIGHVIVGHADPDVSESVYTHRSLSELKNEMARFHYERGELLLFQQA